jgi:hypothetical protein
VAYNGEEEEKKCYDVLQVTTAQTYAQKTKFYIVRRRINTEQEKRKEMKENKCAFKRNPRTKGTDKSKAFIHTTK